MSSSRKTSITLSQVVCMVIILVAALLWRPTTAHAAWQEELRVNIPSRFFTYDTRLPAGEYIFYTSRN